MRTSLIETQQIAKYLDGSGAPTDHLLIRAQALLDPDFKEKIDHQQQAVDLIMLHGRQQLRAEIREVQEHLFTAQEHRSFQERIRQIFNA